MKIYAAFDDTDVLDSEFGTGKLVRYLEPKLPGGTQLLGVVRHQLLVAEGIPYTSHNSPACAILQTGRGEAGIDAVKEVAVKHIEALSSVGSDPGLCIADASCVDPELIAFGRRCGSERVRQSDALTAASSVWLSGHGGTNDGIIGAAAAVGLTAFGWDGRFIEHRWDDGGTRIGLRDLPDPISAHMLEQAGILAVTLERNVQPPAPDDLIDTGDWLRPRLFGGRAVLPLLAAGDGRWRSIGRHPHHA